MFASLKYDNSNDCINYQNFITSLVLFEFGLSLRQETSGKIEKTKKVFIIDFSLEGTEKSLLEN
jgi:hypothetical protein